MHAPAGDQLVRVRILLPSASLRASLSNEWTSVVVLVAWRSANGGACALAYPLFGLPCPTQGCSDFRNITLRNVAAVDSLLSPGVLRGNVSNPMELVFDNVTMSMSNGGPLQAWPFDGYDSSFVDGVCVNGCDPAPAGFVVQG